MNKTEIEVGDKVWWSDPCEDECSKLGEVLESHWDGEDYFVVLKDGTEVYGSELTVLDDDLNCPYCGQDCYHGDGFGD